MQKSNPQKSWNPADSCPHQWLPVQYQAGVRRYQNDRMTIDWTSNVINAHYFRVLKVWCPLCGQFLDVPSTASDS